MENVKKAPLTWLLIALNVIVFAVVEITGGSNDTDHMIRCGAAYVPLIEEGEVYRLFTCMFLHFGMDHLGNNMLMLYCLGNVLEQAVGTVRFLLIYLLGGLSASVLSFYIDWRAGAMTVGAGASGAVFALVGAMIWVLLLNRGRVGSLTIRGMLFMAALSLYYGFTTTGVDNAAHMGGFLAGFVVALLLCHRRLENTKQQWE